MVSGLLGLVLLVGCGHQARYPDTSSLAVLPGRGITNVCEIGMTLAQVVSATGDATTYTWLHDGRPWQNGRLLFVPSLAATSLVSNRGPISEIVFRVQRAELLAGVEVTTPFRGRLAPSLSFEKGKVSKADVIKHFGEVERVATNLTWAADWRRQPASFACESAGHPYGYVWYPRLGVGFVLTSNLVTEFCIFPTVAAEATPAGARANP